MIMLSRSSWPRPAQLKQSLFIVGICQSSLNLLMVRLDPFWNTSNPVRDEMRFVLTSLIQGLLVSFNGEMENFQGISQKNKIPLAKPSSQWYAYCRCFHAVQCYWLCCTSNQIAFLYIEFPECGALDRNQNEFKLHVCVCVCVHTCTCPLAWRGLGQVGLWTLICLCFSSDFLPADITCGLKNHQGRNTATVCNPLSHN